MSIKDSDAFSSYKQGVNFCLYGTGIPGFMPTFGPTWINLYGSTRDYSILDEHNHLNDGLGEGVSFRGRLLAAIRTDVLDNIEGGPANVEVEPTLPVSEV